MKQWRLSVAGNLTFNDVKTVDKSFISENAAYGMVKEVKRALTNGMKERFETKRRSIISVPSNYFLFSFSLRILVR